MNTPDIDKALLISRAIEARERAYAPYSHYQVGAAVLTEHETDDAQRIFTGRNVENAVYPLCLCAERVAITQAVSAGARRIVALAVATANGGTPCGACRQVMREFGDIDMPVYIASADGAYWETTLGQLLPKSFSAEDLEA
jgi:cytidine deaminase